MVLAPEVNVQEVKWLPGELIGAREPFCAARESASMGLLSSVGANVTGLVLQTVEGLVAQRALVGTRQVLAWLILGLLLLLQKGSHEAHSSSSHGRGRLGGGKGSRCSGGVLRG